MPTSVGRGPKIWKCFLRHTCMPPTKERTRGRRASDDDGREGPRARGGWPAKQGHACTCSAVVLRELLNGLSLTFPAVESFLRLLKEVPLPPPPTPPPPPPPAEAESHRGGTMRRSAAAAEGEDASLTSMSMALSAGPRASMLVRLLLRPCSQWEKEISLDQLMMVRVIHMVRLFTLLHYSHCYIIYMIIVFTWLNYSHG